MTKISDDKKWHALYVRSRAEKKVFSRLQEMRIEAFLPLITRMKQWSDRKKKTEEPLFKSYIFVKNSSKEYYDIVNISGAMHFVSFENAVAEVPENQIAAIKRYIEEYDEKIADSIDNDTLNPGQSVRIISGPMNGLTGQFISYQNKKMLLIYIDVVGQYIPVKVARVKVEPLI